MAVKHVHLKDGTTEVWEGQDALCVKDLAELQRLVAE